MRQDSAGKQPQAADVDVEGLVPLLFGDLFDVSHVKNTGIVQQDVDAAKFSNGAGDQVFDVRFL